MRRNARLAFNCAALALFALSGACASSVDLGARLANAAVPSHLPLVITCWEKEFEAVQDPTANTWPPSTSW